MDHTLEIQNILDSGSDITLPPATFYVSNLIIRNNAKLKGSGAYQTIFKASEPNLPIIIHDNAIGSSISNIGFQANNLSNNIAIDFSSSLGASLSEIAMIDGKGTFNSFIYMSAFNGCYRNHINKLYVQRLLNGPKNVVKCKSATGDYKGNPNANLITNFVIYSVRGIENVFDLADSTLFTIEHGLLEAIPDAIALIPGQQTIVRDIWFEGFKQLIDIKLSTLSPNDVSIYDCYFSGANNIEIPQSLQRWRFHGNAGNLIIKYGHNGPSWNIKNDVASIIVE